MSDKKHCPYRKRKIEAVNTQGEQKFELFFDDSSFQIQKFSQNFFSNLLGFSFSNSKLKSQNGIINSDRDETNK